MQGVCSAGAAIVAMLLPAAAAAATLREAHLAVRFLPGVCEVTLRAVADAPGRELVDHRVMAAADAGAPEFALAGAVAGAAAVVGRTASLPIMLAAGRNEYTVRYRSAAGERCPLIVPAAPTGGLQRVVAIEVTLPEGAVPLPGVFPALTWRERTGRAMLAHVPSFVRAPHALAGAPIAWRDRLDLHRILDAAAIAALVSAMLAWAMGRKAGA